jgi:hypothetical protein
LQISDDDDDDDVDDGDDAEGVVDDPGVGIRAETPATPTKAPAKRRATENRIFFFI